MEVMTSYIDLIAAHDLLVARIADLEETLVVQLALVHKQAEDEGLWFIAQTAPEAYLQQELRRLHGAIEANAASLQEK